MGEHAEFGVASQEGFISKMMQIENVGMRQDWASGGEKLNAEESEVVTSVR